MKGILFDLDGVFYIEERLIPGGIACLNWLRKQNIPYRFVTNNTTLSRTNLVAKLQSLGLPVAEKDIVSANYAGVLLLAQLNLKRCRLVLRPEAQLDYPQNHLEYPDAIVIGDIGNRWDYDLLNTLMNQVLDGAEIIALHKGRYHEGSSGLVLDSGAFVAALEHATGKQAIVVGKPSQTFFELASHSFGCKPEDLIMVGDDLINDIKGAQQMGMHSVLVQTGKYRKTLIDSSNIVPEGSISSIKELPNYLQNRMI
ncbi:MAG: TIGR01458 family HAD-type hydrolase [Legionellales bacterium]|nr:TIGR01458 family HAD-type hydrolase [Legionellales bacterium]